MSLHCACLSISDFVIRRMVLWFGFIYMTCELHTFYVLSLSRSLPYLTSGVDRLLHLPSAEAVSAWPNAHPQM